MKAEFRLIEKLVKEFLKIWFRG